MSHQTEQPCTTPLDLTLFHRYRNRDDEGFKYPLLNVENHPQLQMLQYVLRYSAFAFDECWNPLWPMHNPLRTELVAVRRANAGDDAYSEEYIFVWRDLAVMYYKHIGRCAAFSRDFVSQAEMEQCFKEIRDAFTAHLMRQYYEGESGQSNLTQKALGQRNSREAAKHHSQDTMVLTYLLDRQDKGTGDGGEPTA